MNFQDALTALKAGQKVRITSWDASRLYIKVEDVRDVPPVHYQKYLAEYFTQVPSSQPTLIRVYQPAQGDMIFATDWAVVA